VLTYGKHTAILDLYEGGVMTLTPKQKLLLTFIEEFTEANGYAPSQKEIAAHFGFKSLGTVQSYLTRLQRHGFLQKNWNARRGTILLKPRPSSESVLLPLVGKVAAGYPIEAIDQYREVEVPGSFLGAGEQYVLEVEGDSMVDDGILDGDLVIARKQADATNGQTVIALVDNEATIKRYYRRHTHIELHPANPNYEPIIIEPKSHFWIDGIMIGLIRRL
jgi:repressor LexA